MLEKIVNHKIRILAWSLALLLLMAPLIAMQFTKEFNWGIGDFLIFGLLIGSVGLAFEYALKKTKLLKYRVIIGLSLIAIFITIWALLAVVI